jgi:hypothetical protein
MSRVFETDKREGQMDEFAQHHPLKAAEPPRTIVAVRRTAH